MTKPELFDLVELLVDLPNEQQVIGAQGTIVECYDGGNYEVEFSNENGETLALYTLASHQFMVVWQARTKKWVTTTDKVTSLINYLSEEKQEELLNFARFLYHQA
ncbi:DUF4926 domain-containing protein [Gloeocapsa sp. PCC 73106]|uniref:DUF4926 domain-containing protein n=1 Tax=Gloeocapsa sp. PCC 73106 TaxID=102232 RepID=UPI0002ABD767|nr:DUF4926 domain-containing protein [Gloeocapsa sp. PCC 73106]ELR98448.1 hypothetical protein GLO73106DRAFT_00022810 [Gloeocapsa sp. PCC 73106]